MGRSFLSMLISVYSCIQVCTYVHEYFVWTQNMSYSNRKPVVPIVFISFCWLNVTVLLRVIWILLPLNLCRLGPLVCYYYNAPDLTPELSRKLLSQLEDCDNPAITQVFFSCPFYVYLSQHGQKKNPKSSWMSIMWWLFFSHPSWRRTSSPLWCQAPAVLRHYRTWEAASPYWPPSSYLQSLTPNSKMFSNMWAPASNGIKARCKLWWRNCWGIGRWVCSTKVLF